MSNDCCTYGCDGKGRDCPCRPTPAVPAEAGNVWVDDIEPPYMTWLDYLGLGMMAVVSIISVFAIIGFLTA